MYDIQSVVVHRREGLCTVTEIINLRGDDYYLLKAKRGSGENIYVPLSNADAIIRPVMNVTSADRVLRYMATLSDEMISNTKQRRDCFKRKLLNGSVEDIVYLAKQLFLYRTLAAMPENVKFGNLDLELLETAENILYDELELTYGVEKERMFDYIRQRMMTL